MVFFFCAPSKEGHILPSTHLQVSLSQCPRWHSTLQYWANLDQLHSLNFLRSKVFRQLEQPPTVGWVLKRLEKSIISLQAVASISFVKEFCYCPLPALPQVPKFHRILMQCVFSKPWFKSASSAANPPFRECGEKNFGAAAVPGWAPLNVLTIVAVGTTSSERRYFVPNDTRHATTMSQRHYLENQGEDVWAWGYELNSIYE